MLSKISALALIASVQTTATVLPTCTAAPSTCTDYPTYRTAIPVGTVAANTAGAVTLGGAGYACVRNNFAYVWPMTRGAGGVAADPGSGNVRAFYTTAVNQIGTATLTTATTATDNAGCCPSAETACLASNADDGLAYTGVVVTRIAKAASGSDSSYAYTGLNNDFLLAATYQLSTATLGTAQTAAAGWCDPQLLTLTATTNQDLVSGIGLDGQKKCTYIITAAGGTGAPAFVVKGVSAPSAFTFDLHFAEWKTADVTYLAASGLTGSNYFGNYAPNTFPSPIGGTTWNTNKANWVPAGPIPGSIGEVVYWSQLPGDINAARQLTVDSGSLFAQYDALNNSYAGYNNALASSNSAVAAYNTAIAGEKARVGDFFKAIFEAPVKIPARPCPPSQPGAWNGPRIWYNLTGSLTSTDGAEKTAEQAIRAGAVANSASGQYKTISGFLQVSTDSTTFNATTLAVSGHVFGRAGQGAATMPGTNNAFWTGAPSASLATEATGMMVSVFPNVGAAAALTAGQNITLTVKSVAWNTGSFPLNAPAQPAAPAMPEAGMGAKFIAAGLTAATAVAMTLF